MAERKDTAQLAPARTTKDNDPDTDDDGLWDDEREALEIREKREALENSKPFDVHTWSDHPEVKGFVDTIYDALFEGGKTEIKKKHLKVVLLDLYVTWCDDPACVISFSRNRNDYRAGSRYNELNISNLAIDVVDVLIDGGLVEQVKGFKDRTTGVGRLSRIWPSEKLVAEFLEARFGPLDIGNHPERLSVILRQNDPDEDQVEDLEYEPNAKTQRMSAMLANYNDLLRHTFIDIPTLEAPRIEIEDANGKQYRTTVSQRDKFVRRIFNRGSFECGGRFYGGWWQRCPKEWRSQIFMDDYPTNEIDFSGLHVVMMYAELGVPYWEEVGDDPYQVPTFDFLDDEQHSRAVSKNLLLMLLNAKSPEAAYSAFRRKAATGTRDKKFTNEQLSRVHGSLEEKHPQIADQFGADAGIRLMNLDSAITESILQSFTARNIPALSMHDSYVVPSGHEDFLVEEMYAAFEEIMGQPLPANPGDALKEKLERVEELWGMLLSWMPYDDVPGQAENEEAYRARAHPNRTPRYQYAWEQFQSWKNLEGR